MSEYTIELKNVTKTFRVNKQKPKLRSELLSKKQKEISTLSKNLNSGKQQNYLKALDNISFSASKGEVLGIIGLNGSGKSTLSILLINSLVSSGYKVLAVDTDTINHSLSYYYNDLINQDEIQNKNIFKIFSGEDINDNIIDLTEGLSLIHSDVRLCDFRTVEYGRLKRQFKTLNGKYDYAIIDTSPSYDNLTINALTIADLLLIPTIPDLFNYQSMIIIFCVIFSQYFFYLD